MGIVLQPTASQQPLSLLEAGVFKNPACSTIFGSWMWFEKQNREIQDTVRLIDKFFINQKLKSPLTIDQDVWLSSKDYDWLFSEIIMRRSEWEKAGFDVQLDIMERIEGDDEDNYTLYYETPIYHQKCQLTFKPLRNKPHKDIIY